ncbi:uncharacterized protein LOC110456100 isoform X2 [Mizuhopecten yessoensis]|uniref:uncharacterized protein LOC110456100 isoform X2 n=1 Tax=Mizuhopecten yessoensis TaxID=6573 RepID=UPI000B45E0F5|nr:uncharacterized protein LOC110456100 isoform X2 [Mizuhopecten yessoensis]
MMYAVILLLSSWISLSAAILPGSVFPMKSFLQREPVTPPPSGSIFDVKSHQTPAPPSTGSVFPMKSFLQREQVNQPSQGSIFDVKSRQLLDSVTPQPQGTGILGNIGLAPKPAITQPPPSGRQEKQVGDWFLVFRARAGNTRSVVFSYIHPFGTNEDNALPGCLSTSPSAKCNGNYRHSTIDKWRSIGVKRVKLELYKGTTPVAFIIFNGTNTQSTSWFDRKKILSSSWTDIKRRGATDLNFFGRKNDGVNRRLMINKATSSCKDDEGWLIVVEDNGECPYDKNAKYPIFLYSDGSRATLYEDYGKQAEVLAIYVDAENLNLEY